MTRIKTHNPIKDDSHRRLMSISTLMSISAIIVGLLLTDVSKGQVQQPGAKEEKAEHSKQTNAQKLAIEEKRTRTEIRSLLRKLRSPEFSVRHQATADLASFGRTSIVEIQRVIQEGNSEVQYRCLQVLQLISATEDPLLKKDAIQAIEMIASKKDSSAAKKAAKIVTQIRTHSQINAAIRLAEMGAKIDFKDADANYPQGRPWAIVIGPEWKGTNADLAGLYFLYDLNSVTFEHPKITDNQFVHLEDMENLRTLEVKRCPKITNAMFASIAKTKTLNRLSIFYCEVDEACLPNLALCKSLTELKMYGTKVHPDETESFEKHLVASSVQIKCGAFMGIRYLPGQSCRLSSVVAGGAAANAGLRTNDLITELDGKKVAEPADLTAILREKFAGDSVMTKVLRSGEELELKVILGSWE